MLHRSTRSHWRAAAIVRRCMLYAATFPRTIRITGNAEGSNPVNSSTRQPVARRLATQSSNPSASRSGSVPGRRMSLPPAAMLIRSGAIWIARGTCSSATSRSSLPRTARLAYRRPGWYTASWSANRSAQPRNPSPWGRRSFRPSVKLSPMATNEPIAPARLRPSISSNDASLGPVAGQDGLGPRAGLVCGLKRTGLFAPSSWGPDTRTTGTAAPPCAGPRFGGAAGRGAFQNRVVVSGRA